MYVQSEITSPFLPTRRTKRHHRGAYWILRTLQVSSSKPTRKREENSLLVCSLLAWVFRHIHKTRFALTSQLHTASTGIFQQRHPRCGSSGSSGSKGLKTWKGAIFLEELSPVQPTGGATLCGPEAARNFPHRATQNGCWHSVAADL
jgi:hypothetical protein